MVNQCKIVVVAVLVVAAAVVVVAAAVVFSVMLNGRPVSCKTACPPD